MGRKSQKDEQFLSYLHKQCFQCEENKRQLTKGKKKKKLRLAQLDSSISAAICIPIMFRNETHSSTDCKAKSAFFSLFLLGFFQSSMGKEVSRIPLCWVLFKFSRMVIVALEISISASGTGLSNDCTELVRDIEFFISCQMFKNTPLLVVVIPTPAYDTQ